MRLPTPTLAQIAELARAVYGLETTATALVAYADYNFRLDAADGRRFVLKLGGGEHRRPGLTLQAKGLVHLARVDATLPTPRVQPSLAGEEVATFRLGNATAPALLLGYLPGTFLAELPSRPAVLMSRFGNLLGRLNRALASFPENADRDQIWDLRRAGDAHRLAPGIEDPHRRDLLEHFFFQARAAVAPVADRLPTGPIHCDANDHNVLVDPETETVCGLIDFGDLGTSWRVAEPAIAAAYGAFDQPRPLETMSALTAGYHEAYPLLEEEIDVLFPLACARLCVSVVMSTHELRKRPDNEYLLISAAPAWELLEKLRQVDPGEAADHLRNACGLPPRRRPRPSYSSAEILERRRRHLGPSLSLSYREPLHIVRGRGAYLYDTGGRAYLDCVNNVCHVGHCHPRVVAAAQEQIAELNTNTRYLHDHLATYLERLTALLPEPLEVGYLVCTGSEANDLALRLARAYTGARDAIALDGAYHGHTNALIDLSPYKHDGPGGSGAPPWVHPVPMPDPYRGRFRGDDPRLGERYAEAVAEAARRAQASGGLAAFFAEPLLGCGGQIDPPPGFLATAFEHVRAAGGVCIADEVQVGFGRVGSHLWAFETQGVVPDIVTLGKPIGNGHPLAAVITRREIADAFANGMEYFNTFGGNPVSCAVGLAVLDVIEEEGLQERAARVGAHLRRGLEELAGRFPLIGEVRGRGLFLGVELVRDRTTLEPAADEAAALIEAMKDRGVLLSTDGPLHNVIKIKPPLAFEENDADTLLYHLDQVLPKLGKP